MRRRADTGGLKRAAVAVVVVEGDAPGEAAFLLTKRTPRLRAHGGQWALPGGRVDAGETIEQTALRELHEELGVLASTDDIWARSTTIRRARAISSRRWSCGRPASR